MEAISYTHFGMKYDESDFSLKDINLTIDEGDFVVLTGGTGSGKSTLLRQIKREFTAHDYEGSLKVLGVEARDMTMRDSLAVGYVMQFPREQIVTDKVYHELSFGLENMGLSTDEIRLRVSETAHYFGISRYMERSTHELSGGEMQILNLASVMAMRPRILLLDEPTSQLDEVTAERFISLVYRINRELGTTVVIAEHRLDMLEHHDNVIIMDNGAVAYIGNEPTGYSELPIYSRIGEILGESVPNIIGCRALLEKRLEDKKYIFTKRHDITPHKRGEQMISVRNIYFRYSRNERDVLRGLDLDIYRGEVLAIVGGNGVGKSTLLSVLSDDAGIYKGSIKRHGNRVVYIAQNPTFLEDSVESEVLTCERAYINTYSSYLRKDKNRDEKVRAYAETIANAREKYMRDFDLIRLKNNDPNQISGGEKAKLALLIGLLSSPDVLLLDEPTKGLDRESKDMICETLRRITEESTSIVLVTHDIDFMSRVSDRVATLFDGTIVSICTPESLLRTNYLFTTTAHRISRGIVDDVVTEDDLVNLAKGLRDGD